MLAIEVPQYIEPIIEMLRKEDWITHVFNIQDQDIYNIAGYIYNNKFENIEYAATIDLNLLQFMISAVKREKKNDKQRAAIGFIVFCQIACIDIDPTHACYEKSFRSDGGAEEVAEYLSIFNCLNNTNNEELALFSLGYSDSININNNIITDKKDAISKLTAYRHLKEWRSLYLMILKIVHLKYYTKTKAAQDNIIKFSQWCYDSYRFSIAASTFAAIFFGKNPIKNTMKFNPNKTRAEKIGNLENMTWDLYIISKFFESWTKPENTNKEKILASDDKPLTEILRTAIKIQFNLENPLSPLSPQISSEIIKFLKDIEVKRTSKSDSINRIYNSKQWSPDYRDHLINELENIVL